jgi:DNA-directed RNA polymerase specialized sigma24 family protein
MVLHTRVMDTIGRIKAIGSEIAAISAETKRRVDALQAERAELVAGLRGKGWSLSEIADALGISKTRVRQLQVGQPSNAERLRRARRTRSA